VLFTNLVAHVARMHIAFWWEIRRISGTQDGVVWIGFIWLRILTTDSCTHGSIGRHNFHVRSVWCKCFTLSRFSLLKHSPPSRASHLCCVRTRVTSFILRVLHMQFAKSESEIAGNRRTTNALSASPSTGREATN
jgi:hypothetical protein